MAVRGAAISLLIACSSISSPAQTQPIASSIRLCSINFDRDKKMPARVDNEAKACLDDVALNLQRTSDARLRIVGHFAMEERSFIASERAVNSKDYLVTEKGVEPSRIEAWEGERDRGKFVTMYLIPLGAISADEPGSVPVDEKLANANKVHSRSSKKN
jgi:predicted transcriptional regulator